MIEIIVLIYVCMIIAVWGLLQVSHLEWGAEWHTFALAIIWPLVLLLSFFASMIILYEGAINGFKGGTK